MTPQPKPLVFTGPNVLAIMADLKTNSRRIMRVQPPTSLSRIEGTYIWTYTCSEPDEEWRPPHQPGDIVYVAEGYQIRGRKRGTLVSGIYSSDNENFDFISLTHEEGRKWRARKYPYRKTSGRFMYRSLARTYLEILGVKAERIQDISGKDAKAEGCTECVLGPALSGKGCGDCDDWRPILWFKNLWNSIHGLDAWKRNDWTWAYTFKRAEND